MAYTIEQLQAFSNTKPELRYITEEIIDYLEALPAGGSSYLVYTAIMNQSGTDAPVPTVLQNTLGGTVVWTRSNTGDYNGTLSGAFTQNKTWIVCSPDAEQTGAFTIHGGWSSDSVIRIFSYDQAQALIDSDMFYIEIRVYP